MVETSVRSTKDGLTAAANKTGAQKQNLYRRTDDDEDEDEDDDRRPARQNPWAQTKHRQERRLPSMFTFFLDKTPRSSPKSSQVKIPPPEPQRKMQHVKFNFFPSRTTSCRDPGTREKLHVGRDKVKRSTSLNKPLPPLPGRVVNKVEISRPREIPRIVVCEGGSGTGRTRVGRSWFREEKMGADMEDKPLPPLYVCPGDLQNARSGGCANVLAGRPRVRISRRWLRRSMGKQREEQRRGEEEEKSGLLRGSWGTSIWG